MAREGQVEPCWHRQAVAQGQTGGVNRRLRSALEPGALEARPRLVAGSSPRLLARGAVDCSTCGAAFQSSTTFLRLYLATTW